MKVVMANDSVDSSRFEYSILYRLKKSIFLKLNTLNIRKSFRFDSSRPEFFAITI
jgi:hypothetical protein